MMTERRFQAVRSASIADQVHRMLLDAIEGGDLVAGQVLHANTWAAQWNVSRTPIREAFLLLGYQGLVDVAAARFTRLRNFTEESARLVACEWATAHSALIGTTPPHVNDISIARLERIHERARARGLPIQHRQARNFEFFRILRETTPNFALRLGVTATAYRFRLAEPTLPHRPHADSTLRFEVITALRQTDPDRFRSAFTRWMITARGPHDEAPASAVDGKSAPKRVANHT
jgi:DNA-binding GntR family transcriptional regulator